jgi:hypothetical protein
MDIVKLNTEYFASPSIGRPIANADIYVGLPDTDPEITTNQKQLYILQEDSTIVEVSQPVNTGAGGLMLYDGNPVTLLVDGDYSIKVLSSTGSQIYYVPNTGTQAIKPGNYNYPDYSATDQGVTGDSNTLKYYVDNGGTNTTHFIRHDSGDTNTTYTLTTSESIPAGQFIEIEQGAIFDGAGTLTLDNPGQIISSPTQQIFAEDFDVVFTNAGDRYPEWWGAKGDASTDDTTAIQSAIDACNTTSLITIALNEGTYPNSRVLFRSASYKYSALTITRPVVLQGAGMYQTVLRKSGTTGDGITITTDLAVGIKDLSLGSYDEVTQASDYYISFEHDTNSNEYSYIKRVGFMNAYGGINTGSTAFLHIKDCYFNAFIAYGIDVNNTINADEGDILITNNEFNNGGATSTGVRHLRGGGLKIINNKFLGGKYHYLAEFAGENTGQLQIKHNSFDQVVATGACIAFNTMTTIHVGIQIHDNFFAIHYGGEGTDQYGIYSESVDINDGVPAEDYDYLYHMSIGNNTFYIYDGCKAMNLNGINGASIYPNTYLEGESGTTVGIVFGTMTDGYNIVYPQHMFLIDTWYSGQNYDYVTFLPGEYMEYAGDPTNNLTPHYIGEMCIDTNNSDLYWASGAAGNSWKKLNN